MERVPFRGTPLIERFLLEERVMMRTAITLGLFAGLAAAAQGSVVLAHYGFDNGSMSYRPCIPLS